MVYKTIVDANYRYTAAYQEVNARITQRQQALALYVTLVVSLLAALVALKPTEKSGLIPVEWLILGFPGASLCLALLNYKSERAITNLRRFLSALEQLDNAHHFLPSYNTHPTWSEGANQARRFHDYAAAVLVAGGNLIGLGAAVKIYPHRLTEAPLAVWFSALIAFASVILLLQTSRWSYRPDEAASEIPSKTDKEKRLAA
jgi:hypothetical protein